MPLHESSVSLWTYEGYEANNYEFCNVWDSRTMSMPFLDIRSILNFMFFIHISAFTQWLALVHMPWEAKKDI
jgi:hypothetical protein